MADEPKPQGQRPGARIVRSHWEDKSGRIVAVRWRSRIVGEMWVALNRMSALEASLIPDDPEAGLPVYYLEGDDLRFIEKLGETAMKQIHEFKRRFLSPEIKDVREAGASPPTFGM